jgi:hypothetical protein
MVNEISGMLDVPGAQASLLRITHTRRQADAVTALIKETRHTLMFLCCRSCEAAIGLPVVPEIVVTFVTLVAIVKIVAHM